MALICAAATVVIFRDPKDDGTELIIFSKPINRLKLIITKFLVLITAGIIIIVVTTAIFSCTALLPKYIKGDAPHNMWNYALGGLVTFLFFGAVAVIISVASGKIGIMCMTIGVSIVMNITHIALPIIAKTQND
jgi:ABC-type transport system involved in multi-copper enzyme maturation permease subunit